MKLTKTFDRVFDIAVGAALAKVASYDVREVDVLTLDLRNTGGNALTGFQVRARGAGPDNLAHHTYKSAWAAADSRVLDFTTAPDTLAAGASSLLLVNVAALESIELWAVRTNATTLTISGAGYSE